MFCSDKENARLCDVMKMKQMELPRKRILFENGNMQHVCGGCIRNPGMRGHLYLISEHVNLRDTFAFVYGDEMESKV